MTTPYRWPLGPANCAASLVDAKGHIVPLIHLLNDILFVLLEGDHEHHAWWDITFGELSLHGSNQH